jgi:hypothetical protein
MRAALSHSRSRVVGHRVSRETRLLAAVMLSLESALGVLDRLDHANKPPPLVTELLELLLSQDGRKEETRCIVRVLAAKAGF